MAEVILKNRADFSAFYDGNEIEFKSNTVTTRIVNSLIAVKSANKDIWISGPLVYTVVATNNSDTTLANGVFTDILESIIKLDTTADVLVNGSVAEYTYVDNFLTINLPDINAGQSVTITFQVLQV